jgi:hypothetical protein
MIGAGYYRNSLQSSYFGYNGVYRTLIVGSSGTDYTTNATTLAFNVDISGNANGGFTGNGAEYFWRNVGYFKTPNSANNNYNTLLYWNSNADIFINHPDNIGEGKLRVSQDGSLWNVEMRHTFTTQYFSLFHLNTRSFFSFSMLFSKSYLKKNQIVIYLKLIIY